jgi:hypothetical protein
MATMIVEVCNPERVVVCRSCEKPIGIDETSLPIVLRDVTVKATKTDLWFHQSCWFKMMKKSIESIIKPDEVETMTALEELFLN